MARQHFSVVLKEHCAKTRQRCYLKLPLVTAYSGFPARGTVRPLCPAKTVVPRRARKSRLRVSTSCLLLLRRLLLTVWVSIRARSTGREEGQAPFHRPSFAFALVTADTCLSCGLYCQLYQAAKNQGHPNPFLISFPLWSGPRQGARQVPVRPSKTLKKCQTLPSCKHANPAAFTLYS